MFELNVNLLNKGVAKMFVLNSMLIKYLCNYESMFFFPNIVIVYLTDYFCI